MLKNPAFVSIGEGQAAGEEHGRSLGGPGAVLMVAHQGEAPGGKLDSDLVAAAGVQPDADQAFFSGSQGLKLQSGFFDTLSLFLDNKNLIFEAGNDYRSFDISSEYILSEQVESIEYFKKPLKSYWNKDGKTILEALNTDPDHPLSKSNVFWQFL